MHTSISRRAVLKAVPSGLGIFLAQKAVAQSSSPSIPNIESDLKSISEFQVSYVNFLKLRDELKEKPKLSSQEATQLDESATSVIKAIPTTRRSIQSIIEKAKASGVWSRADAVFEQNVEKSDLQEQLKAHLVAMVQKRRGVKSILQHAPRELDGLAAEIRQEVATIRRKHGGFLHFELIGSAYAALTQKQCNVLLALFTIHSILGHLQVATLYGEAYILACEIY